VEEHSRRVSEAAPGVVHAGAQTATEPLVELGLQRVVPRLGGVGSKPNDTAGGILTLRAERQARVAVECLEQVLAKRPDVSHSPPEGCAELPLRPQGGSFVTRSR